MFFTDNIKRSYFETEIDGESLFEEGIIYNDRENDILVERYLTTKGDAIEYLLYKNDSPIMSVKAPLEDWCMNIGDLLESKTWHKIAGKINAILTGATQAKVHPKFTQKDRNAYEKEIQTRTSEAVKEWLDKNEANYCKSNTLLMHLSDPTTTMLSQMYEGRGWDELHGREIPWDIKEEVINELIKKHERIVCLGHGTPGGLIGFVTPYHAEALKGKKKFMLWCNADAYCNRFLPDERGYFACGNMPSDEHEAAWVGYKVTHKYMDDNITYWCKLCGDVLEQCLEGDADAGCKYVRDEYWKKYGHADKADPDANDEMGITLYNWKRTKVAGQGLIPDPADAEVKGR